MMLAIIILLEKLVPVDVDVCTECNYMLQTHTTYMYLQNITTFMYIFTRPKLLLSNTRFMLLCKEENGALGIYLDLCRRYRYTLYTHFAHIYWELSICLTLSEIDAFRFTVTVITTLYR